MIAGALAFAGLFVLHGEARYDVDRLTSQGLPLVFVSLICGAALLVVLLRGGRRPLRPLAAGAVTTVIGGWPSPSFPTSCRPASASTKPQPPDPPMTIIFFVFAVAAALVLPSLALLYTLAQGDLLE